MGWKLNLIIVFGTITMLASVIGSLEQIISFLNKIWRAMLKGYYIRHGSWPLKIVLKSAYLNERQGQFSSLTVEFLVTPLKETILGQCKIAGQPLSFYPELGNVQEWKVAECLSKPRTYKYVVVGESLKHNDEIRIQIEAEGYECESNLVSVTENTPNIKLKEVKTNGRQ